MSKLSRSAIAKKAWKTRKANEEFAAISKNDGARSLSEAFPTTTNRAMSLSEQLDNSLSNLEARLCGIITRINGLL
jgi:hypothetical protein